MPAVRRYGRKIIHAEGFDGAKLGNDQEQADHNAIYVMRPEQALQAVLQQTIYKFGHPEQLDTMLSLLDNFLTTVPIYRLENRPEPEAAMLAKCRMKS